MVTNIVLQHMTFGVLGVGKFGSKIHAKLSLLGDVIWAVKSDADLEELEVPDWVFVLTPNIFHFEQVEFFLNAGANVFVEKPATLNPLALIYLIKLSETKKKFLYVDDVFLYRTDLNFDDVKEEGGQFCWHKNELKVEGSLLDRFAYHHLYLLYELYKGKINFEPESKANIEVDKFEFKAKINNRIYFFSYCSSINCESKHIALGRAIESAPNDALIEMLNLVLREKVSFKENNRRALWVVTQLSNLKKTFNKKIAVVGGGVFGTTIAIELATNGYDVTLFERNQDILKEASSINQYRVHEGYHYPRSRETALECNFSSLSFIKYYRQSILNKRIGIKHYYAISSKFSKTSSTEYLEFLSITDLPYKVVTPISGADLMVEVEENLFDPSKLIEQIKKRLFSAGIKLHLGKNANESDISKFDMSVIATYANLNDWCEKKQEYQFELCEKPVLKLPYAYHNKSIVIMDGPFMCIDPLGDTGLHVMGNVVHAIHHTNVGHKPSVPDDFKELINKGIIKNPKVTNIEKFIESARNYFPDIDNAEYFGSMFTIRTVLPNRDKDDARPTLVEWIGKERLKVFSGKICTSVRAAKKIVQMIDEKFSPNGT